MPITSKSSYRPTDIMSCIQNFPSVYSGLVQLLSWGILFLVMKLKLIPKRLRQCENVLGPRLQTIFGVSLTWKGIIEGS